MKVFKLFLIIPNLSVGSFVSSSLLVTSQQSVHHILEQLLVPQGSLELGLLLLAHPWSSTSKVFDLDTLQVKSQFLQDIPHQPVVRDCTMELSSHLAVVSPRLSLVGVTHLVGYSPGSFNAGDSPVLGTSLLFNLWIGKSLFWASAFISLVLMCYML